jgi:proteic killer suppression protein
MITYPMIKTFKNRALADLWSTGKTGKIDARMHKRILVRLDRLDVALIANEMDVPGFDFHPLRGHKPTRFSVHVDGPWCLTFEFANGDATHVDFEQYH